MARVLANSKQNGIVANAVSNESWQGQAGESGPCWEVHCGDAHKILQKLPADYFSCIVTSPPYFWQRDYNVKGQIGLESTIDGYVNSICDVMDGVKRVLSPQGVFFLNLGDTYYSGKGQPQGHDPKHNGRRLKLLRAVDASGLGVPKKTLIGIPWRVALEMISRGWVLRAPIIWRRENAIPEPNAKDRPWRTYEFVFMFVKSRKYHFRKTSLNKDGVEDIWTIESRPMAGRNHPAVFPAELVRRCLKIGNPKRGSILDPFAGSGTTIKVALELGMDAVAIDLNKKYCKAMVKEFEKMINTI
jgi:DNA modification methylase